MLEPARDATGAVRTATPSGTIDDTGPFFTPFGVNGRFCNTCHQFDQGWTITPAGLQARFDATGGTDPIFQFDGLNYPGAPQDTLANRRASSSLLLGRGVIRLNLPGAGGLNAIGPARDYVLVQVDTPYPTPHTIVAPDLPSQATVFRRPLPTTNFFAVTTVNWDGRNTPLDATKPGGVDIFLGLKNQSNGATVLHAQRPTPIDDATRTAIVNQELSFYTAQESDDGAGYLSAQGAGGGAEDLLATPFSFGATRPGHTFALYDSWAGSRQSARAQVARGQSVFNTKTFGAGGTCTGCHNDPDLGNSSTALRFFDIGRSDPALRSADVPLYTFARLDAPGGTPTGETLQTTDPGRALISGRWADMNKFKVPTLRGLPAHGPYFHDGSAATIREVVNHYEAHFGIAFVGTEKDDLIAFLEAL